jgi:hypothetical protein
VYSLGATLYEVLTLRPPFEGRTLQELCTQIVTKEPVRPARANGHVPRDLETIVLKAMDKDRDRRYRSAGEMARDLRRFAEGAPVQARRVGSLTRAWRSVRRHKVGVTLAAALLALAIGGGLFALQAAREKTWRLELEYARLCSAAADAVATSAETGSPWECGAHDARDIYSSAIALAPDRPEAYLERALASGAVLATRLKDIEAAAERGLPRKTYHLARARPPTRTSRGSSPRVSARGRRPKRS